MAAVQKLQGNRHFKVNRDCQLSNKNSLFSSNSVSKVPKFLIYMNTTFPLFLLNTRGLMWFMLCWMKMILAVSTKTATEVKVIIGLLRCGQKSSKLYPQRKNHIAPFHTQHRCGSCQADAMIPLRGAWKFQRRFQLAVSHFFVWAAPLDSRRFYFALSHRNGQAEIRMAK